MNLIFSENWLPWAVLLDWLGHSILQGLEPPPCNDFSVLLHCHSYILNSHLDFFPSFYQQNPPGSLDRAKHMLRFFQALFKGRPLYAWVCGEGKPGMLLGLCRSPVHSWAVWANQGGASQGQLEMTWGQDLGKCAGSFIYIFFHGKARGLMRFQSSGSLSFPFRQALCFHVHCLADTRPRMLHATPSPRSELGTQPQPSCVEGGSMATLRGLILVVWLDPASACLLETPAHWIQPTGSDGEESSNAPRATEFPRETELIHMLTLYL